MDAWEIQDPFILGGFSWPYVQGQNCFPFFVSEILKLRQSAIKESGFQPPEVSEFRVPWFFFSGQGIFLRLVRMGWLIWRIPPPQKKCKNFSQLKVKKGGFDLENAVKS